MSTRQWRLELLQDSLEEAEEMFEVTLDSPVGAVLGANTKATITILDSINGQCGEKSPQRGTALQGKEVPLGPYPKHGSIQLETLPITLGDIAVSARGDDLPKIVPSISKKRLRTKGNGKNVRPSSVIRSGPEVVYTYNGIMSLTVEDDTAPLITGRTAEVQVTSRGQQRSLPARITQQRTARPTNTRKSSAAQSISRPVSKPCTPELRGFLHYNESLGQLLHCNGVSWKAWAATDAAVNAQKCPQGWTYRSHQCYMRPEIKATWSEAARTCRESFRANLVSVVSKADMDWLWDFSERKPFWIGLNDREGKGRWEWVGGEPVTYTNWRRSPPRTWKKGNKKCVLVWKKTKWQIRDCKKGRKQRYVCYVKT